MNGNNGDGLALKAGRLAGLDRLAGATELQPPTEKLLDQLADRLGERLEGAMREELTRKVFPRLDEMESKLEDATQRMIRPVQPVIDPVATPADQQGLQRRARRRVD